LATLITSGSLVDNPEAIIAVYRGWHAFERAQGGPSIIDFDLINSKALVSFNSREEVLRALNELLSLGDDGSHESQFLRDKLVGSVYYLRTLMGQQIPFREYLQHTLGVTLVRFSEQEIELIRQKVSELLARFDLELTTKDAKLFEEKLIIRDPDEVRNQIVGCKDVWLTMLREKGIPAPENLKLQIEYVKVDAYWSNWISGSFPEGIKLLINLHSSKRYDLGKPLVLCLHEICGHAAQMSIWHDLIVRGKINQACGITTVHTPEAFIAEGLGQTVADLLGGEEDYPSSFLLSRWLHSYTLMIFHNVHLMIYEGVPIEEMLSYARTNLPFSRPAVIEAEIRDRATDPLYRTYQLSYAASEFMIRKIVRGFNSHQTQQFFAALFTEPMTPIQLQHLAQSINVKNEEARQNNLVNY
jgi:hypothetical protein